MICTHICHLKINNKKNMKKLNYNWMAYSIPFNKICRVHFNHRIYWNMNSRQTQDIIFTVQLLYLANNKYLCIIMPAHKRIYSFVMLCYEIMIDGFCSRIRFVEVSNKTIISNLKTAWKDIFKLILELCVWQQGSLMSWKRCTKRLAM